MPSLSPPIVLLTGATSGIGRATAKRLAERDAHILLHGRTEAKAREVQDELAESGARARIHVVSADLSSMEEVRALAANVAMSTDRLDVLINNAGLAGGEEHTWEVNVCAPFLLAHELRPLLRASTRGRIVNVASEAQAPFDLAELPRRAGEPGPRSYGKSKLALIMLSFEMARRWQSDGIGVIACHPGTLLDTKMVREHFGAPQGSAEEGAEVLEYLAFSDDLASASGEYFRQKKRTRASEPAYDEEARRELWDATRSACGVEGG